jgi:D-alanine-D-alanine ligase
VELALRYDDRILYEAYVKGRELTVGIVGEDALPVGEIIPDHEIFDYECKYQPGLAREVFPAHIRHDVADRTRAVAFQVHRTLFMRDFSRVDFILDEAGTLWCLEANAIPGMTSNSLLPRGARAGGIPFAHLCDRIARTALKRLGRE